MSSTTSLSSPTTANIGFFVAGAFLSTLVYFLIPKGEKNGEKCDVYDESDDSDVDEINDVSPSTATGARGASKSWGKMDGPYKMILCVNKSLGMSKGKIAAQCAHAAVGCYKRSKKQCPNALRSWEWTGCAKIAISCPTQEEMEEIMVKASSKDIPYYMVEDAGRTQIAAGSRTVLGLGPAPVREFDGLTDHLKLM